MEFQNLLHKSLLPCSMCTVYLPFRFSVDPTTRWDNALHLIPHDETIFSVDRIVAEHGVYQLMDKFREASYEMRKLQCICNYGHHFTFPMIQVLEYFTAFNLCGITLTEVDLLVLNNRYSLLEHVVLRVRANVSCQGLRRLYKNNKKLIHIFIIGHTPNDHCSCPLDIPISIKYFGITDCAYPLSLSDCIANWKNLKRLRVESCVDPPADFLERIIRLKPDLDVLQYNFVYDPLIDNYDNLAPFSSNITYLTLINNMYVTDNLVKLICKICPNIEYLLLGHLNFNSAAINRRGILPDLMLTDESLSELPKLKNLRCLGIFGLHSEFNNNEYLQSIKRCDQLEILCLTTQGTNITDVGCDVIRHCLKLTKLILMGYNFTIPDLKSVRDVLAEMEPGDVVHEVQRPAVTLFISNGIVTQMDIDQHRHFLLKIYKGTTNDLLLDLKNIYL